MTLANTAIIYSSADTDLSISEMQSLACQFHEYHFNVVRENTGLSISEVFFQQNPGLLLSAATSEGPIKCGKLVHF